MDRKLKPFHGARVCFLGFPEEEEKHMIDVLEANGGTTTNIDDSSCTHVVSRKLFNIKWNSLLLFLAFFANSN